VGLIRTARSIRLHLKPINSHYTSHQSNSHCLYNTEVSTCNISKLHHPKNEHLNANVKNCQYVFPNFFSFYWSTAQDDSQNKMRSPTYIMTQTRLLKMIFSLPKKERDFVKFVCLMKVYMKLRRVSWSPCRHHEGIWRNHR